VLRGYQLDLHLTEFHDRRAHSRDLQRGSFRDQFRRAKTRYSAVEAAVSLVTLTALQTFASWWSVTYRPSAVSERLAFTSCQMTGKKTFTKTVYYMAIARPKGGIYLFATTGWDDSEGAQEKLQTVDGSLRTFSK
jgi:hypothetical protein